MTIIERDGRAVTAPDIDHGVVGDREQPGAEGTARAAACAVPGPARVRFPDPELRERFQSTDEDLGGEVGGDVRIGCLAVAIVIDGSDITLVERCKGEGIAQGERDECGIGRLCRVRNGGER
ncbi:MAG TPA: hypothetical protein VGR08_07695 [Thermomicrobiales bacterium]|nr:hypothetical protein [Thermomicrobiales bacterium]